MNSLAVPSPAKINLYLRVLGRRPDGYHRLYTLFHRISLADSLRIWKKKSGFLLRSSDPRLLTDEDNLMTRAYRLLQMKFPRLGGVSVSLRKKIPIGGGLGGGSSNAAAFLLGMKKLYGLKISQEALAKLGKSLGADVPFFIFNVNQAVGKGAGDDIFPRPLKRKIWFLLVLKKKGLSTKKVYRGLPPGPPAVSLTKATRAVTILCDFLGRGQICQAAKFLRNDLETSAIRLRPAIRKTIQRLQTLGAPARMSGSGPTVFAVFSNRRNALRAARKLLRERSNRRLLVCHTL